MPGQDAAYSNSGYILLGILIERISGKPYPVFMKEEIFTPLGMDSTFVRHEGIAYPENTALPYDDGNHLIVDMGSTYGDSGIYSTLNDMYLWDQALYTERLLRSGTWKIALTNYTRGDLDYGYGWMIGLDGLSPSYRHGGFEPGGWGRGVDGGYLIHYYRVPALSFSRLMISNGGVFANNGFRTWTDEVDRKLRRRYR